VSIAPAWVCPGQPVSQATTLLGRRQQHHPPFEVGRPPSKAAVIFLAVNQLETRIAAGVGLRAKGLAQVAEFDAASSHHRFTLRWPTSPRLAEKEAE
jgi:hypothetical protein